MDSLLGRKLHAILVYYDARLYLTVAHPFKVTEQLDLAVIGSTACPLVGSPRCVYLVYFLRNLGWLVGRHHLVHVFKTLFNISTSYIAA